MVPLDQQPRTLEPVVVRLPGIEIDARIPELLDEDGLTITRLKRLA